MPSFSQFFLRGILLSFVAVKLVLLVLKLHIDYSMNTFVSDFDSTLHL